MKRRFFMGKRVFLFFVVITAALPSFAQSATNGAVTAKDNTVLAGASVVVKITAGKQVSKLPENFLSTQKRFHCIILPML